MGSRTIVPLDYFVMFHPQVNTRLIVIVILRFSLVFSMKFIGYNSILVPIGFDCVTAIQFVL